MKISLSIITHKIKFFLTPTNQQMSSFSLKIKTAFFFIRHVASPIVKLHQNVNPYKKNASSISEMLDFYSTVELFNFMGTKFRGTTTMGMFVDS